jgi:protein SCO1/2
VSRNIRNTVFACVAFVAIVLGAFAYSLLREPLLDEAALREQGTYVLPAPREVAPFSLVDDRGQAFDNQRLRGRWTLLYFGFTSCPDICPTTLSAVARAEQLLKESDYDDLLARLQVVLVTVDPERDTDAVLHRYVTAFSPDFVGVTGAPDALAALATQLNAAYMKVPGTDGGYVIDHTGNLILIDPDGRYYAFMKLPHEPERIARAYASIAKSY